MAFCSCHTRSHLFEGCDLLSTVINSVTPNRIVLKKRKKNEDHMTVFPVRKAPAPLKPVPKVQATALAGALITIILYIATLLKPELEISAEVASAITTLLSFVVGYMTPAEGFTSQEKN
jgi:hypothetical protein